MAYQLKLVDKSTQVAKVIEVVKGNTVIKTPNQHTIEMVMKATGKKPTVHMKRKGNNLLIEFDEESSVELEDYYSSEGVAFFEELGSSLPTDVPVLEPVAQTQPVATSGSSMNMGKVLAGVGLALGGIAGLASAGGGKSGGSGGSSMPSTGTTTTTPSTGTTTTPKNSAPTKIELDNLTVNENAKAAIIGTLKTTDPDDPTQKDSYTYTISDNRFEVNSKGELKLKEGISLDYETEKSIDITVTSTDNGKLSLSKKFTINVKDMAENRAPTDITLSKNTVDENAKAAIIGTLKTTDPDDPTQKDSYTYTISDNRFEVNSKGELKLKEGISLDYETEKSIDITVTSTDNGKLSLSKKFTINIKDMAENRAPTDIILSKNTVDENAKAAIIGTLKTTDPDDPTQKDSYTYTISDNRFEVNSKGELKLKEGISLDYETEKSIDITVISTDSGKLSTQPKEFTINVKDVAENRAPTDITLSKNTVDENAKAAIIGTLKTTDPDDPTQKDSYTYTISDNRFEVNSKGELKLKEGISLDYETEKSIDITVTSTDSGQLSTQPKEFTITVNNLSDSDASIKLEPATLTVNENTANVVFGKLSMTGKDANPNPTYTVDNPKFFIENGELKLKAGEQFNYETEQSVTVKVKSTDKAGEAVEQTFTINVVDVNEAPTAIALVNQQNETAPVDKVNENAPAGTVIGVLKSTDVDANETHVYTLNNHQDKFEIVGKNLQVKQGAVLDFETTAEFTLNITTKDKNGTGKSFSDDVTIKLVDVNEKPTAIKLDNLTVNENAKSAVIGKLTTDDPDAKDKGEGKHTYTVSDDRFEVNSKGELKLKEGISLDYETEQSVKVSITSTDSGKLSTGPKEFTINVKDVVESTVPKVDIKLDKRSVDEESRGATVGRLTASDGKSYAYKVNDERFEVVDGQLKLKTGVKLDYETLQKLSITVEIDGQPSTRTPFDITVNNINEANYIFGTDNDNIYVSGPDKTLTGTDGNDTLVGLKGNDYLRGGKGNDTYIFSKGDGQDVIEDWSEIKGEFNTIKFTDVNLSDIEKLVQVGGSINIHYGDQDVIDLRENVEQHSLSKVIFADGMTMSIADLMQKLPVYIQATETQKIVGDVVGDTTIIDSKGEHEYWGNSTDGGGNDTYVFATGGGKDIIHERDKMNKIVFNDVESSSISFSHAKDNVTIHYGNGDQVSFSVNAITEIKFQDTTWSGKELKEKLHVPYWVEALMYNFQTSKLYADKDGNGEVYYAFPTKNLNKELSDGWSAFTTAQKDMAHKIFAKLSTILNVEFKPKEITQAEDDVIYLQNTRLPEKVAGLGGLDNRGGNVWMAKPDIDAGTEHTMAHEIGHALGLSHPQRYPNDKEKAEDRRHSLTNDEDKGFWTIMSYDHDDRLTDYQPMDIAALQYLYGVNPTARAGNEDKYFFNTSKGEFVWDGAGNNDTIDASSATADVYLNLNAGTHSYIGQKASITQGNQLTINHGTVIETAIGGTANDTLIGNDANNILIGSLGNDTLNGGAGQDLLVGGEGNDTLIGGKGNDTLNGGAGSDTFAFSYFINDATGGHGHDTVQDFQLGNILQNAQADKIDLTGLLVGYSGDKSAKSLEGYLSVLQQNGNTVVSIDRDGAGTTFAQADLVTLEKVQTTLAELLANQQIII